MVIQVIMLRSNQSCRGTLKLHCNGADIEGCGIELLTFSEHRLGFILLGGFLGPKGQ